MAASAAETLDARGLKCPLPVLKTEKRLAAMSEGAVLIVLATDPMARIDIPLYCRKLGYPCSLVQQEGVLSFTITRSAAG